MNDLINFLTSERAIPFYMIILIISMCYIFYYAFRKSSHYRKKKQNTMELKRLVEDVKIEENKKIESKGVENKIQEEKTVEPEKMESKIEEVSLPPIEEKKEPIKESRNLPIERVVFEKREEQPQQEIVKPIQIEEKEEKIEPPILETIPTPVMTNVPILEPTITPVVISTPKEIEQEKLVEKTPIEESSEIIYTNTVPEKEEAKEQLKVITEQLEKEQTIQNIELTEFEKMQEDTAIISLDELMKKAGEMTEKIDALQYEDEGNEPITLEEFEKRKQEVMATAEKEKKEEEAVLALDDLYHVKITPVSELKPISSEPKFKSSPVISPVYGIEKEEKKELKNTELELENTANYEKLDEEIRKTNKFIAALKELQKKLD